jgi:hypothetical protein
MLCCFWALRQAQRQKVDGNACEIMNGQKETSGHWFFDLITMFSPDPDRIKVKGTPEEMITQAGREAFAVSSAAGLIPGPLGLAAMIPELVSVTKIQLNLVHGIASHYGSDTKMDTTLLLLIFGEALGLALGKSLTRRAGTRLVIRVLETQVAKAVARKISSRIVAKAIQKSVVRWIPLVAAPVLGAFSRSMTVKIGRQADKLFSQGITIEVHPASTSRTGRAV